MNLNHVDSRYYERQCSDNDEALISAFLEGDELAFEAMVHKYQNRVSMLALNLTKSVPDAEEVMQEVFFRIYRKLDQFNGHSTFSSWLYRITVNASFSKLRSVKRHRAISLEDVVPKHENGVYEPMIPDRSMGPDEQVYFMEIRKLLLDAIRKLPEKYQYVIILKDIKGYSNKRISKELKLSIPAVKSRLHRARHVLAGKLASHKDDYTFKSTGWGASNLDNRSFLYP